MTELLELNFSMREILQPIELKVVLIILYLYISESTIYRAIMIYISGFNR